MKTKITRRIGFLLLAVMMMIQMPVLAFAAENTVENNTTVSAYETASVMPCAVGTADSGYISAKGELTLYPTLNSYVGIQRTFVFWATSLGDSTPSGNVRVYLYNPDGSLREYFTTKVDQDVIKTYNLPSSGTYTVKIYSEVNEKLHVNACWTTPDAV